MATPRKAVGPTCTVADPVPDSICLAMLIARLIGTAKAWVVTAAEVVVPDLLAAVLMPTTSPLRFSSGPPESPGWMLALVWSTPTRRSDVPVPSSLAVIDEARPVTLPVATDGSPPRPPALPTATTWSLSWTPEESPMVAVARPDAFLSFSTAMSRLAS